MNNDPLTSPPQIPNDNKPSLSFVAQMLLGTGAYVGSIVLSIIFMTIKIYPLPIYVLPIIMIILHIKKKWSGFTVGVLGSFVLTILGMGVYFALFPPDFK